MVLAARWLDALTTPDAALRTAIVRRAMADIGIEEITSNSSPYLDSVLRAAGASPGDPWCAAAVRQWYADAGAMVPVHGAAACESWRQWARAIGTLHDPRDYQPVPGDMVLYADTHGVAHHCGVVVRVAAAGPRGVEGNTSFAGFNRDGVVCDYKPVSRSLVCGYISPVAMLPRPALAVAA